MRRVAVLLVIGGAVAGLSLTAASDRLSLAGRETIDTVPVLVPDRPGAAEYTIVFGQDAGGRTPLAARLAVFRSPARPSDAIPPALEALPMPQFTPEHGRSRLLLARPALQIYAYPTKEGAVCYVLEPRGEGSCLPFLIDGAFPQVRPWQDVWGLVDDGAVRVDVRVGAEWRPAELGRNAFYLPLPTHVAAPAQILVHERTGPDHRYLIKPCRIHRITPLAWARPVGPGPCG